MIPDVEQYQFGLVIGRRIAATGESIIRIRIATEQLTNIGHQNLADAVRVLPAEVEGVPAFLLFSLAEVKCEDGTSGFASLLLAMAKVAAGLGAATAVIVPPVLVEPLTVMRLNRYVFVSTDEQAAIRDVKSWPVPTLLAPKESKPRWTSPSVSCPCCGHMQFCCTQCNHVFSVS